MKTRLFIGSSTKGLSIAEAIQQGLAGSLEPTLWTQGVLPPSHSVHASLVRAASEFDGAVLVFTPDDFVQKKGVRSDAPRDNVVFELGLFAGALGPQRVFVVYCPDDELHLPSDIAGIMALTFSRRDDGNWAAAVGPACTEIKRATSEWPPRGSQMDARRAGAEESSISLGQYIPNPGDVFSALSWSDVLHKLERADSRIDILQTWVPWLDTEVDYWERALAKERVRMRVLLIDQHLAPYRTAYRNKSTGQLAPTVGVIRRLAAQLNRRGDMRVQGRFYSCLPFGPLYLIDGEFHWGLYYAHCDSLRGPAFCCGEASRLGRLLSDSYERTWQRASSVSGTLELPGKPSGVGVLNRSSGAPIIEGLARPFRGRLASVGSVRGGPRERGVLTLLRHAHTQLNASHIFSGSLDVNLSDQGIKQASSLQATLGNIAWDWIYCSTLQRSRETAMRVLGINAAARILDREELRERRMGDVEGLLKSEYWKVRPHYGAPGEATYVDLQSDPFASPMGGESYADVFLRVYEFLEHIIRLVEAGERVLICSHEGPIRMMRMALDGMSLDEAISTEVANAEPVFYRAAP